MTLSNMLRVIIVVKVYTQPNLLPPKGKVARSPDRGAALHQGEIGTRHPPFSQLALTAPPQGEPRAFTVRRHEFFDSLNDVRSGSLLFIAR